MPYFRAVLGENSIVIKEQSGSRHSQGDSEIHDDGSQNSSFLETTSLISCVTCLSDNSADYRTDSAVSNPNIIPYSKILNARAVTDSANCAPVTLNPFNDEQSLDGEETPEDVKMSSVMLTSPYFQGGSLVEVTFAKPRRNDLVPKTVTLLIEPCSKSSLNVQADIDIVEEILKRSYRNSKRGRSIFVLINPYGGKGKAKKLYLTKLRPILVASGCTIDVKETTHVTHARAIAEELDIDKYDVIACASGDGIPHEVLNGLYRRNDRAKAFNKLAITQLPCGSGNAMSISCYGTSNPSYAALSLVKATEVRIDVMCCMQPSYAETPRLSFLSQTYGIIAESDINTEFMRWLGSARFELGVTLNLLQRKRYPCDLYVKYVAKSKNELREHYLKHKEQLDRDDTGEVASSVPSLDCSSTSHSSTAHLTEDTCFELYESSFRTQWSLHEPIPTDWERVDVSLGDNLGIFYVGKMPYIADDAKLFPAALPDDGAMDMVITDGRTPLLRMVPILLSLDKGSHVLQPEVEHSKILAYRLVPKMKNSIISVDGERFPFEPIQVEVLPRLVKTLLKDGCYVDTEFNNL